MATQKLQKLGPDEGMNSERARKLNKRKRQLDRKTKRKLKQVGLYL